MNKTVKWILIVVILAVIAVGIILWVRQLSAEQAADYQYVTIWKADVLSLIDDSSNLKLDFERASDRVKMARRGFERGFAANPGAEVFTESVIPDDWNSQINAETIADIFSSEDILLTVGATTDETTMNTSMEMNFFNIPMLIPFADGNLSPDDSPVNYSIRMTPTAQKYAEYFNEIFSSGYFSLINNVFFQDARIPEYDINVAVFFTDNFNGHNTAVNITQKIMDNGYNVEIYAPYTSLADLQYAINSSWQTEPERMKSVDSIVIIGEDGASMRGMAAINQAWKDYGLEPLIFLVGFLPNGIEEEVLNVRNVYAIHQSLDFDNCPADIVNRSEAMGYAAGYIVSSALIEAQKRQEDAPSGLRLLFASPDRRNEMHQDYLTSYRENLRSVLLEMDEMIPCYGMVDFDVNSDSNISLELVYYTGPDQPELVRSSILLDYMIDKVEREFNLQPTGGN